MLRSFRQCFNFNPHVLPPKANKFPLAKTHKKHKNSNPGFRLEKRFDPKKISGYLQKKLSILSTRGLEPSRIHYDKIKILEVSIALEQFPMF